eukprot:1013449_1
MKSRKQKMLIMTRMLVTRKQIKILFICYFFGAIYYGGMEVLGAAIFNLLITQLNSSEYNISMLFIGYHISYSISCIGAAYILDKFINTHKWNAFILFLG